MRKLVEKFSMTYDKDIIIMMTIVFNNNNNDNKYNKNDKINNNDNHDDDDDIDWDFEQDQEVGHGLEAHHPERRDVLVELLNATHLLLWDRI